MTASSDTEVEVLLVEDNPDDARFVEQCILEDRIGSGSGDRPHPMRVVQIDTVERLSEALELLRRDPPDVVLLDLTLPDSSGLGTLDRVVEYAPWMPVVVLTGRDDAGIGIEAIQRGAQDYLRKADIGASLLRRTLRYAVERKRNQRELRDRTHRLALLNRIVRQDLRNDVSMIVGRADELCGAVPPGEEATLEALLEAANHAIDLVDTTGELMDVLSADDGVEPAPCDLYAVLDAAIARFEAERDAAVVVERERRDDAVTVHGSSMLEAVFRHLLATAADYADRTIPELTVAVDVTEDAASVTLSQAGNWLPESRTEFLATPGGSPEDTSVGVGLYLVRTVLDAVDGSVDVDELRHGGTAVTIRLQRVTAG